MTLGEFNKNVERLKIASESYYNTEYTTMTDNEYDVLVNKCREYDKENKINNPFLNMQVGFEINGKAVVKHIKRMYSQKDIFTIEEAEMWMDKKRTDVFYLEPKLDGCSCNLLYVNGKLKSVATRGDGFIGQDITYLADGINGIPKSIPYTEQIEIRGELLISFKNFAKFEDIFKNPRNMVAGSLSLLDVEEFKTRCIDFIPWGFGFNKLKINKSEYKAHFQKLGFKITMFNTTTVSDGSKSLKGIYKNLVKLVNRNEKTSSGVPYLLDGLMVYINKHEEQSFYGYASRFPLYSMAFKLPAKEVSTILTGIEYNIGRNGNLSIVGILEPVELLGTTVSRATLHNMNYIAKKDIRIGDKVIVYKAGDIVPAVKESFTNTRTGDEKIIKIKKCPFCKEHLNDVKGILNCSNVICSGIIKSKLKFAVSKKCLNLQGIGDEFINKAVDRLNITHVADFYNTSRIEILVAINTLFKKGSLEDEQFISTLVKNKNHFEKATKYYDIIGTIKNKPFSLILESFSLPNVGAATCLRFENLEIDNIDKLIDYLNKNQTPANKRILDIIDDKTINFFKEKRKK